MSVPLIEHHSFATVALRSSCQIKPSQFDSENTSWFISQHRTCVLNTGERGNTDSTCWGVVVLKRHTAEHHNTSWRLDLVLRASHDLVRSIALDDDVAAHGGALEHPV